MPFSFGTMKKLSQLLLIKARLSLLDAAVDKIDSLSEIRKGHNRRDTYADRRRIAGVAEG